MIIANHNCTQDSKGNKKGAEFQNKTYGQGRRVFTEKANGDRGVCTVCGQK